jgi:hypothetical protein
MDILNSYQMFTNELEIIILFLIDFYIHQIIILIQLAQEMEYV